ncbi:MAG TPA: hypothetical protein VEL31_19040 [Ktedonobacteraceae bacterium]|nr:hypothetical protein [Ktedonobacteraceae bacterium]
MKYHQLLFKRQRTAEEAKNTLLERYAWLKISQEHIQKHPEGYLLTFSTEQELVEKTRELLLGSTMPAKVDFNLEKL